MIMSDEFDRTQEARDLRRRGINPSRTTTLITELPRQELDLSGYAGDFADDYDMTEVHADYVSLINSRLPHGVTLHANGQVYATVEMANRAREINWHDLLNGLDVQPIFERHELSKYSDPTAPVRVRARQSAEGMIMDNDEQRDHAEEQANRNLLDNPLDIDPAEETGLAIEADDSQVPATRNGYHPYALQFRDVGPKWELIETFERRGDALVAQDDVRADQANGAPLGQYRVVDLINGTIIGWRDETKP
jgi:hypothetical protein